MKAFLNWGFLNIGGYTNVDIPTTNIHNFGQHILKPTQDQTRPSRTVWQSPKKDWVHESGVCYKEHSPNIFSGVYVNGDFYPGPTGNNQISYQVDYPNGQIIFNQSVPTNAEVLASYSYKSVQIYNSDEFPGWKEIQFDSNINTDNHFNKYKTGDSAVHPEHRVQLPAVIIEIDSRESSTPFRLGDRSLIIKQDVLFHIIADNKEDRHKIVDILRLQKDRHIWLFDTNKVIEDKVYELGLGGNINPNSLNYEELTNSQKYRWKLSRISDIQVSDMVFYHMNLFGSTVRMTHEFIQNDFVPSCVDDTNVSASASDSISVSSSQPSGSSAGSQSSSSSAGSQSSGSSADSKFSGSSAGSQSSSSSAGSQSSSSSAGSQSGGSSADSKFSGSSAGSQSSGSDSISGSASGISLSVSDNLCYSPVISIELLCGGSLSSDINLCYSNIFSLNLQCQSSSSSSSLQCYSNTFPILLDCS